MRRFRIIDRVAQKRHAGFSLIELVIVISMVMILSGIVAPLVLTAIAGVKLRYSASDLSGLMQKARIEAARRNSYYPIRQTTLASGMAGYYVDLNSNSSYDLTEPMVEMGSQVTVRFGTGSGAPGETAFVASLTYTFASNTAVPNFNARGLPCVVSGSICPTAAGQGFIYFLSRTSTFATNWASVVVTPSGRVQVFVYDGARWNQA